MEGMKRNIGLGLRLGSNETKQRCFVFMQTILLVGSRQFLEIEEHQHEGRWVGPNE